MKSSSKTSNEHEFIMDTPPFNKSTLGTRPDGVHKRRKTVGKHFGKNFGKGMDEANGSKTGDVFSGIFFRQEKNVSRIKPMKVNGVQISDGVDGIEKVHVNDVPTTFEECAGEPIGAGGLITGKLVNGRLHFTRECESSLLSLVVSVFAALSGVCA